MQLGDQDPKITKAFQDNSGLNTDSLHAASLPPISPDEATILSREQKYTSNWAGNLKYSSKTRLFPNDLEELRGIVTSNEKIKVIGSRHSFNEIADSLHLHVCTERLNNILNIDEENLQVTIEGGVLYGDLNQMLDRCGFALHNLASLPHISVAGACATATHGSGVRNGNLATAIKAIEVMKADGELITLHRGIDPDFNAAAVSLGALGVVTKLTLDIMPRYLMRQDVYEWLPLDSAISNFQEIHQSAYSVSFFTDWRHEAINQVWLKQLVNSETKVVRGDNFFGAIAATENLHPIKGKPTTNCTPQLGIVGPWHERLPHFLFGKIPSSGVELQSEFFVSMQDAADAIARVAKIGHLISDALQISEIRTIAADDLWMSASYNQPCVGIHFTWHKRPQEVEAAIKVIESALDDLKCLPHWGKLSTMSPELRQARYTMIDKFQNVVKNFDPDGKFRNEFISRNVFGEI